jgi:membrane dipeptidase
MLKLVNANGGVVMVNFYSGFIVADNARAVKAVAEDYRKRFHDLAARRKAMEAWFKTEGPKLSRGTIKDVANHIDHIVKVAGIDHVGIGSDFDGITSWPKGLDDVSTYPRLTDELLRRGYSEGDIHKILGGNVLRAFRGAESVARRLQTSTPPEVDEFNPVMIGD